MVHPLRWCTPLRLARRLHVCMHGQQRHANEAPTLDASSTPTRLRPTSPLRWYRPRCAPVLTMRRQRLPISSLPATSFAKGSSRTIVSSAVMVQKNPTISPQFVISVSMAVQALPQSLTTWMSLRRSSILPYHCSSGYANGPLVTVMVAIPEMIALVSRWMRSIRLCSVLPQAHTSSWSTTP